jgi:hypothetical protein
VRSPDEERNAGEDADQGLQGSYQGIEYVFTLVKLLHGFLHALLVSEA